MSTTLNDRSSIVKIDPSEHVSGNRLEKTICAEKQIFKDSLQKRIQELDTKILQNRCKKRSGTNKNNDGHPIFWGYGAFSNTGISTNNRLYKNPEHHKAE